MQESRELYLDGFLMLWFINGLVIKWFMNDMQENMQESRDCIEMVVQ